MSGVAGLRGTGDWGTDERPKNFREAILFYEPNGGAPLTALMAKTGKKTVNDPDFNWWSEPVTITRVAVEGALGATDTLVVIDSGDPSSSSPAANYGTATHLSPGDLLMVEAAEASFSTTEYVEVVSVISDTQFTVRRGAAGSTAATIADETFLLRVGSVFAEGTSAPKAASRNPIKYQNYTQIFKTTYDITRTAANTHIRTGKDPLANDRKRRMQDHATAMELAFMFGRKSEITGENGKPKRTTDGLRRQITSANVKIFTADPNFTTLGDSNNIFDAVYKVFDWKTGAGDTRIAFCGNGALNYLNQKAAGETNVRFNMNATIKVYGMEFREFIMPQGRLLFRTHPLLNQHTLFTNSVWIVDFSAIKWCPLKGGDTKHHDNVQAKDDDSIRGFWLTEAGLMVDYGGLSCGYLGEVRNF